MRNNDEIEMSNMYCSMQEEIYFQPSIPQKAGFVKMQGAAEGCCAVHRTLFILKLVSVMDATPAGKCR